MFQKIFYTRINIFIFKYSRCPSILPSSDVFVTLAFVLFCFVLKKAPTVLSWCSHPNPVCCCWDFDLRQQHSCVASVLDLTRLRLSEGLCRDVEQQSRKSHVSKNDATWSVLHRCGPSVLKSSPTNSKVSLTRSFSSSPPTRPSCLPSITTRKIREQGFCISFTLRSGKIKILLRNVVHWC